MQTTTVNAWTPLVDSNKVFTWEAQEFTNNIWLNWNDITDVKQIVSTLIWHSIYFCKNMHLPDEGSLHSSENVIATVKTDMVLVLNGGKLSNFTQDSIDIISNEIQWLQEKNIDIDQALLDILSGNWNIEDIYKKLYDYYNIKLPLMYSAVDYGNRKQYAVLHWLIRKLLGILDNIEHTSQRRFL